MEGRVGQDGGAVRRSGVFSGRQVPLEMGTVRVGGSGRPVPALFAAAASRRAGTATQEAVAASTRALSPRVTLEPHPRSPFRRQETLSETAVRVPEDASASRFHVKKVIGPHPLSARSPQLRLKGNASTTTNVATSSTELTTSRQDGTEVSMTGDGIWTDRAPQTTKKSHLPEKGLPKALKQQELDAEEQLAQGGNDVSAVDLMLTEEQKEEVDETAPVVNTLRADSEDTRPPELPSRLTLALPSAKAGAGTFVSSMPSLTKLRSSFTARELALFTQRLDTSDGNAQTRYHVASHPHSAAAASSTLALQTNPSRAKSHDAGGAHKRTLSSSVRRSRASIDENREEETSWRQVDTSIDHIYEDPSIDQMHLHLLQSHQSSSGQKKRKMVERQRVLAAASGLREHQSEEQRRQDELQQRKLQLQKMSEAIRLQNQRAVRARAVYSAGLEERRVKAGRRSDKEPTLPERKPPVPRLSRVGSSSKRKRKPKHETPRPQGEVSASILMGLTASSSVTATQQELVTAEEATSREEDPTPPTERHQVTKRKPAVTTPRLTKRKKQGATVQPPVNEAAVRAREQRRAIAREYMQMQKQSRRIWSAKAKEQSQREQEKRQQQLEILEATRLKNLRLSKKRPKDRQKPEIDYALPEDDSRTTTVALSVAPAVSQVLQDVTKPGRESNDRGNEKDLDLDEPNVDNENDQAIGNFRAPENSLHFGTGVASSVVKSISTPQPHHEAEQTNEADERVRKLLELREKAAALSTRLSGLRNRTDKPETVNSSQETLEHGRLKPSYKHEDAASEREHQSPCQRPINHELVSFDDRRHITESEKVEREGESSVARSESGDDDHNSEGGSGKAFSRRSESPSDHDSTGFVEDVDAEPTRSSLVDDEYESLTITRSRQVIQHDQAVHIDATDGVDSYDESGDGDIDVRSIGVYSIGVVWPLEQHEDAVGIAPETQQKSRSKSLSSSGSSSLAGSAAAHRDEWHEQFSERRDDVNESNDEAFEVEFYQQLRNRLAASTAAVDERKEDTTASYVDESGEEVKSESESDSDSDISESVALHSSRRRLSPAVRSVVYRQQSTSPSPPNAGLMRLLREADDSLSVIDREARKLYKEQKERSEREEEAGLQKRIEAEKKELVEKDMALEAVMATLTGKKVASEASDVDDDVHSCDEETDLQAAQYKRLEEIMDEVEQERARENSSAVPDKPTASASETEDTREPARGMRPSDGVAASPSSDFWDHMVSACTVNEFSDYRPRVKIDDSELVAQREARLLEDEQKDGCVDSPPRVHSPRTLSRRLMAAVDYQETILEAHMQLNMMEHAQELETVQAETITLAQAFKEEMEQNATSHQLALDHATLEKKFDGDLHEVVQQLDSIRQVEEQERAAYESRMEQELKLANLRECSVQTEASQRVDAATSAALYVDGSTSPLRSVVDAAVQHETAEQSPANEPSVAEYDDDLEYASEEESNGYEETFEKESQVQVEVQDRRKTSTSDVPSIAESLSHSPPESEKDSESEIQSVLSERDGDDDFEESATAKSIADEDSFAEESAMATSAVESIIDDEIHVRDSNHSTTRKDEGSASMEYEDDFTASSQAMVSAVDSVIDDDIHENESNRSTTSKDDVSASMEYEDDFEASSPKMKVIIPNRSDRINLEASVEDAVTDEMLESDESREPSHEDVDSVSDDLKSGEDVVSDDGESDHYSSQFEDGLHGVSKDEKKLIAEPAVSSNAKTSTVQKLELELDITQPSDSVAAAYVRDLERRKQAEESLLDLRLQAVKQKYQRELKQLGNGLGNEQLDLRVARELKIREETLTMAFLAETAKVESLKAASTARYYQDLHAFRSLSLDWPHSAAQNDGQSHQYDVAASVHAPPPAFLGPSDGENCALAERTGNYDDDFASDAVSSHGKVDDNVSSHISASIDTEHSEMHGNTSESSDVPDASDVAEEEDLEQANKEGPSDSVSEEEEEYDDEFASIGEDTSVRKATSVDEVAEDCEIADQGTSNSVRDDSEYDDDFASVSESTPDQLVGQTNSSAIVEVEIDERDIQESGSPSDAGEISSGNEIVVDEPGQHLTEGDVSSDDVVDSDQRKYSDDEFEVSEGTPDLLEGQTNALAIVEMEIEEQDIQESGSPSAAGEIPSDSEILEDEPVQHSIKEDGCDDVYDSDQQEYSDDEFEEGPSEESAPPPSEGVLEEQSVNVREGHSSFEDSSSTKLPVADVATLQHATGETYNPHALLEDSELASAIETVAAQLATSSDPSVLSEDKPLAASVSVSVSQSHEEEEESLTKSIEERAAQLEVLRQKITERKSEILAVQKQMRVEHRRERLVAEEKLLWSEMESVERLLHADEAALTLCRQRNRLDQLYLDAKQQKHSVGGKPNSSCEQGLDLLIGFDYVEEAQTDEHQQRSRSGLSSTFGARSSTRRVDLLDGYAYVEAVEPINADPVVGIDLGEAAIYHEHLERAAVEDDIAGGESVRTDPVPREGEASQQPIVHNESEDSREDVAGEPSAAMMDHEYPSVSAADCALDKLQESAGPSAEKAQPDEADVADGVRLTISQDDREDEENCAVVSQQASFQHSYDREVTEELRLSTENTLDQQDSSDLLAGYAFVEVAEAASSVQEELLNVDLLRDFDYVETVKSADLVQVDGTNTAELCASEELDDIYDDAVVEHNTGRSEATKVSPEASTVPQVDAQPHVGNVGESVEDADDGDEVDDVSPIDGATFVKSDPLVSSNGAPSAEVLGNEEVADRVASLLYADLLQELENDISSTISYSRNTQQHFYEQKLQGTTHLASTEDSPQIVVPGPVSDGIDRQVDEVGSGSMEGRYITDWSVEQSSESLDVQSFNMEPPAEAPEEDAKTRNSNTVVPDDSADESITDTLDRPSDDEEFPIEVSENEELVERSSSPSSENGSIQPTATDLISSVGGQEADASAEYKPVEEKLRDLFSDDAVRSERVADAIFASVFDEILSSELRFWSRERPTASSTQTAVQSTLQPQITAFSPPKTPCEAAKRAPMPDPRARDRAAAQRIVDQVEIVDGEIRLPAFDNVDIKTDSSTSQVLYDVTVDIARDCFRAIKQSGETTLNDVSMLAVIQRHVQTELDELLAVREQSEHELERQLQLISDEAGAETGLTGDVLLSQNCIASNVSSIVSNVQTKLSRPTETLPAHPSLLPRTPVSRAKSTSILSSLQNQQDQELQQRITGMILQDLLLDAGLP